MKIVHVVGARPNFMKAEPVISALKEYPDIKQVLVHTGQHYDRNMSAIFFQQLGLDEPDINLGIGSGSHTVQTAGVMVSFEQFLVENQTDLVLVYGDINSTLAAALVCTKLRIPFGHVEAGLRSRDRTMPEEINRIMTDQLADVLFTPSVDGNENLAREGIPSERIHFVGNVMIDTLIRFLPHTDSLWPELSGNLGLSDGGYAVVTLHRPSNVDDAESLFTILDALKEMSADLPLLFPVHPRIARKIEHWKSRSGAGTIRFIEPVGYLEFLTLQRHALLIMTDSGGIQEESTFLGVPCLTLRENTERPVTVTYGTNHLVGRDMQLLSRLFGEILQGKWKEGSIPPLWDGFAGERIANVIVNEMAPHIAGSRSLAAPKRAIRT